MREQQVSRNEFVQHDALGLAPALHPLPNVAGHGRLRPEELTKLSLPPPRLRVRPCCQAPLECRHWLPWLRSRKPDVGEEDRHHCQRRGHGVVAQKQARACRRPSPAGGLADLRVHPLARRQSRAAEPVLRCLFDAERQLGRDFVGLVAFECCLGSSHLWKARCRPVHLQRAHQVRQRVR